jgi:hypothetical protein
MRPHSLLACSPMVGGDNLGFVMLSRSNSLCGLEAPETNDLWSEAQASLPASTGPRPFS